MIDAAGDAAWNIVTVLVEQTPTLVAVTPSPVNITAGGQQSFSAALEDQFGAAVPYAAYSSWRLSGNGTLSAADVYTAPDSPSTLGTATITVVSTIGPLTGTAVIDIVPPLAAAPASLTASLVAGGAVDLSWPASAWATGYNVYRGTVPGGESATPLNASPLTATTYSDSSGNAQTYVLLRGAGRECERRRRGIRRGLGDAAGGGS